MFRWLGLAIAGAAVTGGLAGLGTQHWLSASYDRAASAPRAIVERSAGADEAFWLRGVPAPTVLPVAATEWAGSGLFETGTRFEVGAAERISFDVVSATPAPAGTGLVDAQGRPLILVVARQHKGERVLRFLVEAPMARPETGGKSL